MITEPQAEKCFRIFAYGSLMWRPDFEFVKSTLGQVTGYHRRLSVYSNHYRGTPEKNGLVLGLDRGGACVGLVYDIAPEKWADVLDYVRKRELVSQVYHEVVERVSIDDGNQKVEAVTYVVDPHHPQFAPPMSDAEIAAIVQEAHGSAGSCLDYVWNTIMHLRSLKIHDDRLESLARHLPSQAA